MNNISRLRPKVLAGRLLGESTYNQCAQYLQNSRKGGKDQCRDVLEKEMSPFGLQRIFQQIKLMMEFLSNDVTNAPTIPGPTKEHLDQLAARKRGIQNRLWRELGIRVDKVVQGGGTSNTRNESDNPENTAISTTGCENKDDQDKAVEHDDDDNEANENDSIF
ncbi:hypothetical protein ILUMI_25648 [Ignelater luminosus]|uniref:Uncharacterized protein n=1 Tax=Ignelater luminosus TaxID=2038154 RepID=A0A8K0C566_IGNLU|nr:hypothetical protein ILUMI_25648 [Ignelater luminosus]